MFNNNYPIPYTPYPRTSYTDSKGDVVLPIISSVVVPPFPPPPPPSSSFPPPSISLLNNNKSNNFQITDSEIKKTISAYEHFYQCFKNLLENNFENDTKFKQLKSYINSDSTHIYLNDLYEELIVKLKEEAEQKKIIEQQRYEEEQKRLYEKEQIQKEIYEYEKEMKKMQQNILELRKKIK
jgi:hypothetical protein